MSELPNIFLMNRNGMSSAPTGVDKKPCKKPNPSKFSNDAHTAAVVAILFPESDLPLPDVSGFVPRYFSKENRHSCEITPTKPKHLPRRSLTF